MHTTVKAVTDTIIQRSQATRAAYVARLMAARGKGR